MHADQTVIAPLHPNVQRKLGCLWRNAPKHDRYRVIVLDSIVRFEVCGKPNLESTLTFRDVLFALAVRVLTVTDMESGTVKRTRGCRSGALPEFRKRMLNGIVEAVVSSLTDTRTGEKFRSVDPGKSSGMEVSIRGFACSSTRARPASARR